MSTTIRHCLCLALISIFCTSCGASSRMGEVVVSDIDGIPCFSVPKNLETRAGVPLDALLVSELTSPDETTYPDELWRFSVEPPGTSIVVRPEKCIRYGAAPKLATQGVLKPLQPFHVYVVHLHAVPQGTSLRGYKAEFCIILDKSAKIIVKVIPWDDVEKKWRYDVCEKQ